MRNYWHTEQQKNKEPLHIAKVYHVAYTVRMKRILIGLASTAVFLLPAVAHGATVSLEVPFFIQAPNNTWKIQPYKDACEEASAILVEAFYTKKKVDGKFMARRIKEVVQFEHNTFGSHKDTNAKQTAQFISDFMNYKAHAVMEPTIEQIKQELDAGRPVIVPYHMPLLKNPHFGSARYPYHMNVLVGYDDEKKLFIANEVGTRHGDHYTYPMDRIMNANHDFNGEKNTHKGAKIMIFTEPKTKVSRWWKK